MNRTTTMTWGPHRKSNMFPSWQAPATDSKDTILELQRNGPPFSSQGTEVRLVKWGKEEEGWKPKRVLQNPLRQYDYSVRDWLIYFFKVLPLSATVSSFPFFFLGRRGVVNNMEVGSCHRVVSLNIRNFTSRRLSPLICNNDDILLGVILKLTSTPPFQGGGGRGCGVFEYKQFPQFFQATETVTCPDRKGLWLVCHFS